MTGRRTRAALAVAAVGAMLTLAACGGSTSDDTADGGKNGGETRTVRDTMNGDISGVPVKPKRVVALWRTGSELADLGVKPVAALEGEFLKGEMDAGTYAKYEDIPTVGTFQGVDVEKVIKAKPDLIVGMDHGNIGIDYDELEDIAPTVILKIAEPPDVWKNYPQLADVVGKSTGFERDNAALSKKLAAIERRHGKRLRGAKAVHLSTDGGKNWISTKKSLAWERLDAAGFGYMDRYTKRPARYVEELASENIPDLNGADVLFYAVDLHGKKEPDVDKLLRSESFKRLPAVKAGNVFPLTSATIYTFAAANQQVTELTTAAQRYTSEGTSS
ncbi:ABC transporter substrate-binding protein [Streptomyces sp. AJS327]|uniref:ABC transporter substrate-binding protein n=1 Tax=Streptomyces sp. AJS327 TaxID=2545265 RepID=UPI0015DED2E4|nr:ABC transporter substrate-binding protein [Streptomyces sp. AJS327]MBA0050950.1 ABC transporter substrate-binding protein [Streptomyces sp. AJS327]